MPTGPELRSTPELLVELYEFLQERKTERERKNANAAPPDAAGKSMSRRAMMTGGQDLAAVSPGLQAR